jgi:two-component system, OmpR family, response regulator
MNSIADLVLHPAATADRPLLGLTVLVVEDSRFAADALRLMCLRSGARFRRADSLSAAERHLRTYRPNVVIVDQGLPDGLGAALLAVLARATPRVDVLLGLSGDPAAEEAVLAAGADGFLAKPLDRLGAFQASILRHLPTDRQPPGPRLVADEGVAPDLLALRDDLAQVAPALSGAAAADEVDYAARFLGGLARSTQDQPLTAAVDALRAAQAEGRPVADDLAALARVVRARLDGAPAI